MVDVASVSSFPIPTGGDCGAPKCFKLILDNEIYEAVRPDVTGDSNCEVRGFIIQYDQHVYKSRASCELSFILRVNSEKLLLQSAGYHRAGECGLRETLNTPRKQTLT